MRRQPERDAGSCAGKRNIGVRHGEWGEDVACEFLRLTGYDIVERNSRPCSWDARYEIDIVAYDRSQDTIVFVEVKQHRRRSPFQRRMRSVGRDKKRVLRTACRAWLRRKKWFGAFRFDVVEVYGDPDSHGRTEVDHIERVRLFEDGRRFVNWVA